MLAAILLIESAIALEQSVLNQLVIKQLLCDSLVDHSRQRSEEARVDGVNSTMNECSYLVALHDDAALLCGRDALHVLQIVTHRALEVGLDGRRRETLGVAGTGRFAQQLERFCRQ